MFTELNILLFIATLFWTELFANFFDLLTSSGLDLASRSLKIYSFGPWIISNHCAQFHKGFMLSSFSVILLTDRQTDGRTDTGQNKIAFSAIMIIFICREKFMRLFWTTQFLKSSNKPVCWMMPRKRHKRNHFNITSKWQAVQSNSLFYQIHPFFDYCFSMVAVWWVVFLKDLCRIKCISPI